MLLFNDTRERRASRMGGDFKLPKLPRLTRLLRLRRRKEGDRGGSEPEPFLE